MGYSAGVLARERSDSTIALCVEAEGHYNWLRTFAYSVWEFRASPRETYLLHSGAHIPSPWFACILVVDFLRSVLFVR